MNIIMSNLKETFMRELNKHELKIVNGGVSPVREFFVKLGYVGGRHVHQTVDFWRGFYDGLGG